jgi:putative membrane-bound dehydrogenase-like protein
MSRTFFPWSRAGSGRSAVVAAVAGGSFGFIPLAAAADGPDASLVRSTEWQSAEKQASTFTVPPGFKIELFASEPMINKPINLAFDGKGRLWVTSNTEYPFPAAPDRWVDPQGTRVRDSRDAIKILEDTNGDGKADKVTDFADGLNVPIGVLPYKDGCIAWSIPNIWYFADTDGDGKCDERKILFGPLGYEKDTHGNIASLRMGPDGWVYATHGFNNVSRFEVRPENRATPADPAAPRKPTPSYANANVPREQLDWGNSLELQSGNVFRFKPDGSAVEIWAWGQVNPFGLTWDAWGNLYSADCHSNPITQLIRGATYPSFGRPDLGLGFGPVLCEHSHGSTGICGPLYLDGGVWGADWDDHMLVCNPVTSRINHDIIAFTGATPKAVEQPDFLSTTDPWFRPVDIQLGPEGALYVADFYNKVIGHYEVDLKHPGRDRTSGRIWRVVKDGVRSNERQPTDHQRVAHAVRFGQAPANLNPDGVPPRTARILAEQWMGGPADRVPVAAVRELGRTAAAGDTTLRHALQLTLRHALTAPTGFANVPVEGPEAREVAAIARTIPTPEAAGWLLKHLRHTDGGDRGELARSLTSLARNLPAADVPQLVALARQRFADDFAAQADLVPAVTNGLAERGVSPDAAILGWAQEVAAQRLASLGASATPDWEPLPNSLQAGLPASASPWGVQPRPCADGAEMATLSSLPNPGGDWEKRTGLLRSKAFPMPAVLSFWLSGHRGAPDQPARDGNFVRLVEAGTGAELVRVYPPRSDTAQEIRWTAAELKAASRAGQLVRLEIVDGETGDAYAWLAVGRIEPAVVGVEAFQSQGRARLQLQALAGLLRHSAPRDLREKLAAFLPPPPPAPPSAVTAEQRAELDGLIRSRLKSFAAATPDVAHGGAVFALHCANCHAIGGQGALVGPQLEGVGQRGAERLMEDILDPNRNIDSNFYVHVISKKDGSVVAGLERGSVGEVLLCVDAAGKEQRIAKAEIEKNELTGLSLMPAAFGLSIPEPDFNDLIGFLLSHGAAKAP